ncbi:MAG TPA: hypothetical protein VNE62_00255 [Actinomycetota bacterium]|nr:hypothetical protein [Actinomycetota bacterium]
MARVLRLLACFAATAALVLSGGSPALAQVEDISCDSFETQEEAQDYYDSNGRPQQLDPDKNGRACDQLPRESEGEGGGGDLPQLDDAECTDFDSQAEAQAFFEEEGGPAQDPHGLDADRNGKACDNLAAAGRTTAAAAASPAPVRPAAAAAKTDGLPRSGSNTVWIALFGLAALEAGWGLLLLSGRLSRTTPPPWLRGRVRR